MVLVVLGALPCLLTVDWRRSLLTAGAFAFGTVAIVGPIVFLWGGLVPPHSAVQVSAVSFSTYNMIRSFAYAATAMLILAPHWFALDFKWWLAIFGVIFASNAFLGLVRDFGSAIRGSSLLQVLPRWCREWQEVAWSRLQCSLLYARRELARWPL